MPLISRQQKAIIRRICREQEESFLRILEQRADEILRDLQEEGYEVTKTDVLEQIMIDLQKWDAVRSQPEDFLNLLDENNIGMIKHHLVNMFPTTTKTIPIWRKINLKESLTQN